MGMMAGVSIPEKREIPFEVAGLLIILAAGCFVSIPEKREIPFEGYFSNYSNDINDWVSIPEKREIPFEDARFLEYFSTTIQSFNP